MILFGRRMIRPYAGYARNLTFWRSRFHSRQCPYPSNAFDTTRTSIFPSNLSKPHSYFRIVIEPLGPLVTIPTTRRPMSWYPFYRPPIIFTFIPIIPYDLVYIQPLYCLIFLRFLFEFLPLYFGFLSHSLFLSSYIRTYNQLHSSDLPFVFLPIIACKNHQIHKFLLPLSFPPFVSVIFDLYTSFTSIRSLYGLLEIIPLVVRSPYRS
jgi:hypothetical protein